MNRAEYLAKLDPNTSVTFIIAKAVRVPSTSFYTTEYSTTPIYSAWEWQRHTKEFLVINADHPPIDITGHWVCRYNQGHLRCAILTTEADLLAHYGEKQGKDMIEYYKREVV